MTPEKLVRNGEMYVYAGSAPKSSKNLCQSLKKENGRKTVFTKGAGGWYRCYVSAKFYPEMCKVKQPWHGRGMLTPGCRFVM